MQLSNSVYPWQTSLWRQLQQVRANLPHAILLHGPTGIGKLAFADQFAQSLLCEALLPDGFACCKCPSCGWFDQYSHPDYRRVRPGLLDQEDANGSADGDSDEAAENDNGTGGTKTQKSASKVIRIAQIRELSDFMNISTHRQGRRVVLLYPVESLNAEASNALLKTLEEPLPGTVMLLVAENPASLLPTIVSRCRQFPMPMPPREQALGWLNEQGVVEAEAWLSEVGGAPLAALEAAEADTRDDTDGFLRLLANPSIESLLKAAERLQKVPVAQLVVWMQRWLYDIFSAKYAGRIRYYPRFQKEIEALAARCDAGSLLRMLKSVGERKSVSAHPLAPRLFIEDMLLEYHEFYS